MDERISIKNIRLRSKSETLSLYGWITNLEAEYPTPDLRQTRGRRTEWSGIYAQDSDTVEAIAEDDVSHVFSSMDNQITELLDLNSGLEMVRENERAQEWNRIRIGVGIHTN